MRKILNYTTVMVLIFLGVAELYASEVKVESRIEKVIVYPDSALISRQATIRLNTGSHEIIFADIIPEIEENSLRVSGRGTAEVKLFGAQVKKEYLEETPSERIKQIKEEIQKLEDELRKLNDSKNLLSEEKQFLISIRLYSGGQIPKDLITKIPNIAELEGLLKFLDEKMKENYQRSFDCDLKIRGLENKIAVLNSELSNSCGPIKKLKRFILVELEALKAGSLDLTVSYLVKGTFWRPIYDARVSLEKDQMELVCYGIVKQMTGENWEEVEILLATAKPTLEGRMPEASSWFVYPFQPQERRERYAMGGMLASGYSHDSHKFGLSEGTALKAKNFAENSNGLDRIQEAKVEYTLTEQKGIAVVYKIPRKTTVKSDGSEYKLPIFSSDLKTDFEYFTYPRATPFAYLGSRITNAKELQLLAGPVNVFLEGDFVSGSRIDNISPAEEFDLYLGIDENLKVKREELQKKTDDILVGNIHSSTKRTTYRYKITVENYKSEKIKVNLFETMPISQDEQIKVKIEEVSLQPKEKEYKDKKGIWRWELELAPKAKQEIFYTYSIEHPREMWIAGL